MHKFIDDPDHQRVSQAFPEAVLGGLVASGILYLLAWLVMGVGRWWLE